MKNLNEIVQTDIYRYKKNKLSANLTFLGLAFNCLYFMLLYGIKIGTDNGVATRFASLMIGFSVVLTLVTLLVSFLAEEGIKGYNKKYAIVLWVLAAFQIFRIFGYPLYGLQNNYLTVNYFWINPTESTTEFIIMVVYLVASAASFIAAGVIGWIRAVNLEKFVKSVEAGEIDVDATLKELDEQDEKAAASVNSVAPEEVR